MRRLGALIVPVLVAGCAVAADRPLPAPALPAVVVVISPETGPPGAASPDTTAAPDPPPSVETTSATTTTTTATTEPQVPARGRLVIHAVGDVGFSLEQNAVFAHGGYGIAWTGLRGIFQRDHLTIINLECAPSERGEPLEKEWVFRCPLAALAPMRQAGVDVAGLANNHAGDMGRAALVDGRAALAAAGIHPVGAGRDLDGANLPVVVEIDGWRVAVVALSRISGGDGWFAAPGHPGVAPATLGNIEAAVGGAAAMADIVIVSVHWGEEGAPAPSYDQRVLARAMIDAGAGAIVGHHPHRLQGFEVIDRVPVFWSLGNFVWPDLGPIHSTTAVAEIVVESDGSVTGRMIPAYIVSHGHPVLRGSPDPSLLAERTDAG
jgi:poly-gamma-glutamate synthesis protein (capsule biosynthesis protein)